MAEPAETLADETMSSLDSLDIPEALQKSIARHHANLSGLAASLLVGGQSEDEVRQTLETVFASFKAELTKTILAVREQR